MTDILALLFYGLGGLYAIGFLLTFALFLWEKSGTFPEGFMLSLFWPLTWYMLWHQAD